MAPHTASVPASEIEHLLRAPSGTEFRATERLVAPFFNCRSEVTIGGTDGLVRPHPNIPARLFDGTTLPFTSLSFDVVVFVDVLHHTLVRRVLLPDAMRVGKRIPAEDHLREELLAPNCTLWIGLGTRTVASRFDTIIDPKPDGQLRLTSWEGEEAK